MEMTMHQLMFGTSLDETVSWIIADAVEKNTEAAYLDAAQQLRGIQKLWITITSKLKAGSGIHASLAISNHISDMERFARTVDLREAVTKRVRELRAA